MASRLLSAYFVLVIIQFHAGITKKWSENGDDFIINKELERLREIVLDMDHRIAQLNEDKMMSQQKIERLEKKIEELETLAAPSGDLMQDEETDKNRRGHDVLVRASPEPIAFTAVMAESNNTYRIREIIQFPTVITNKGNGYDGRLGVFIAPVTGTYYFSASIMSFPGDWIETEFVKNGNSQFFVYSGGDTLRSNQGSNDGVIEMDAGDRAWIRVIGGGGYKIFGFGWSTFTGFRIL